VIKDPKERAAKLFADWEKGYDSNPAYRKRVNAAVNAVKREDEREYSYIIVAYRLDGGEMFVRSIPYGSNVPTFSHLIQHAKLFSKEEAKKWESNLFADKVAVFKKQKFHNVKWCN
jgi:hypothetical protein